MTQTEKPAKRHPVRRALMLLLGLCVATFIVSAGLALLRGEDVRSALLDSTGLRSKLGPGGLTSSRTVAVVPVEGEIRESLDLVEVFQDLAKRASVAAVVVRVNSPGGGVAPSQEIHSALRRLAEKKPVVVSMGDLAASGGYYIASAADRIVANPGTLTGSIGVIMMSTNVRGLFEKLGLQAEVIKAGALKDMGSPFREMSDTERGIFQATLDQVHEQFIAAVATGRKLDLEKAKSLADGRIYTGAQAKELGLVDDLGGLEDAVRIAGEKAGISGEPKMERVSPYRGPWWWRYVASEESSFLGGRGSQSSDANRRLVEAAARLLGAAGAADGGDPAMRLPLLTHGLDWCAGC